MKTRIGYVVTYTNLTYIKYSSNQFNVNQIFRPIILFAQIWWP